MLSRVPSLLCQGSATLVIAVGEGCVDEHGSVDDVGEPAFERSDCFSGSAMFNAVASVGDRGWMRPSLSQCSAVDATMS